MSMPGAQISRRRKGWMALAAAVALVALAFGAPRIHAAVRRLFTPPASNMIIVVPENSEMI
jgi:hypothetical protein